MRPILADIVLFHAQRLHPLPGDGGTSGPLYSQSAQHHRHASGAMAAHTSIPQFM